MRIKDNLKGKIIINENIDTKLINTIKNSIKGDSDYISLGKKLIKEIFKNAVSLVKILKYKYGQY